MQFEGEPLVLVKVLTINFTLILIKVSKFEATENDDGPQLIY